MGKDASSKPEENAALAEAERRYRELFERSRALFDTLPVPAFTKDREGRYLECNEAFAQLSGLSREEILGKTVFELWGAERARVYHQKDQELLASGTHQEYEGTIPAVQGEPRDVLFVKDVFRDDEGEVGGIVGVYVDVTEKKRTEQALRLQAEEHRALLATSLDGYWLADDAGRILDVNEAYCRMSGYSRREILALTIADLDATESPDDMRRHIERLRARGSDRFESRHRSRDGTLFDVEVSATYWSGGERILAFLRDISERNRRQRELEESEERFRTLLDAAPLGVLVAQEGRYVFCNPEGARMLGYDSPADLTGVGIEDTIAPEHRPTVRTRMAAASHGHRNPPVELQLRHRDGTTVWSWSTSVPIVLDGSPAILIAGQDTTELKRAERALKDATFRQQEAVRAGQVGLWDWDLATNKVWYSPEWKHQIGYGEDEIGNDLSEWESRVHPEDLPEIRARIEGFLAGTTAEYQVEFRFRHRNGSWRWILAQASIVRDESGRPVRTLGSHVDITDRKLVELERERFLQAIEQAGEGFVITDARPTIQYVNPAFERITGYSREQVLGQNPRILKSGQHDPDFYRRMWERLARGETWHGHLVNRRKDGTLYTEEASISPVLDRKGEVINYVAVKRDVTRELRLEEEREELEAQFQQAQKLESIGRLAGGVAHDLNNLLSPILGYGELLVEDLDAKDGRRTSAEAIVEAGERARELVLQLLTFSRKQVLEFKVFDPNEMLARFRRLLRRTITEDVELELKLAEGLPPIRGDVGKLEQVIMNLAVNAQDAMPEGGRLTIETGVAELDEEEARGRGGSSSGSFCRIRVRDTGMGMSEETLGHLFEPFYTTKARGKGTGLGLSTVYGIVKQHGGLITVESAPGAGTTFEILLPGLREEVSRPLPESRPAGPLEGSETILVVEDHEAVRSLAAAILWRQGYRVLQASNGREALRILETHEGGLDLVLTDVVMPEMNGKELCEAVAALRPGVKALFMSGYTDDVIVHRGVLLEGINFLPKPFSVRSLSRKVREVLDGPEEGS